MSCHMHGDVYMSSHVQKCDFVFYFEMYIYVYFVYVEGSKADARWVHPHEIKLLSLL